MHGLFQVSKESYITGTEKVRRQLVETEIKEVTGCLINQDIIGHCVDS